MDELIEKLGQATGPDRELDVEIWLTLHPEWRAYPRLPSEGDPRWETPRDGPSYLPTRYTDSLDDALELVPDGWQWQVSNRAPEPKAGRAYIHNKQPQSTGISGMHRNPKYQGHEVTASTPVIALCIVALMARR